MSSTQQPTDETKRPERIEIPEPMARLLLTRQEELQQLEEIAAEAQAQAQAAYSRLVETLTAAGELVSAPPDYVCKNIYAGFTRPDVEPERLEELAAQTKTQHQHDRIQRAAAGILAQAVAPRPASANGMEPSADEE